MLILNPLSNSFEYIQLKPPHSLVVIADKSLVPFIFLRGTLRDGEG